MINQFISKKPHYEYLRKKWISKHKNIQQKVWDKHSKALQKIAAGSLGTLLILSSPPQSNIPSQTAFASKEDLSKGIDQNIQLANQLQTKLPNEVQPLNLNEESDVTEILSRNFGFKVIAEMEGVRLNRNYGLIGGEQHLYRYPGDNLYAHADTTADWAKYGSSGIAPGLGAWGYFAPSKEEFTELDKEREKYYLAIQTFLSPGFAENVAKYRDFFKFRKMLVVNAKTGQAVVAVIGDAGPAQWTGKHLGGSPEVMDYVGLASGPRKGAVLYFFLDDPRNQIPLGPVKIKGAA